MCSFLCPKPLVKIISAVMFIIIARKSSLLTPSRPMHQEVYASARSSVRERDRIADFALSGLLSLFF